MIKELKWWHGFLIAIIAMFVSSLIIGFLYIPGGSLSAPLNLLTPILLGISSILIYSILYKLSKILSFIILGFMSLMNIYYAIIMWTIN